jgi:hypothetical protein
MRPALVVLVAALAACGGTSPRPSSSGQTAVTSTECRTDRSVLVVTVALRESAATPTGVTIAYVGEGHDDFDDGRFDDWVELQFTRAGKTEARMVSVYAPARVEAEDGFCWELRSAKPGEVVLAMYPRID